MVQRLQPRRGDVDDARCRWPLGTGCGDGAGDGRLSVKLTSPSNWLRHGSAALLILLSVQVARAEPPTCAENVASFQPKTGVVGSAETAKSVAMIYLKPVYGTKQIEGQRPFKATLRDGVWIVTGSLPRGLDGGVAHISICRRNGKVLRIF